MSADAFAGGAKPLDSSIECSLLAPRKTPFGDGAGLLGSNPIATAKREERAPELEVLDSYVNLAGLFPGHLGSAPFASKRAPCSAHAGGLGFWDFERDFEFLLYADRHRC